MSDPERDPAPRLGLADRYGSDRPRGSHARRRLAGRPAWLVGILTVLVLAVGGYVVYTQWFATPIDGQRVAFEELPGNAMEVTVDVNRDDSTRPAVCVVTVRDISGAESGRREIYIAPGVERLETTVRSIGQPVTADVYGCSYDVPQYMSTP